MNKFRVFRLISVGVIFAAYRYSQPSEPPLEQEHRNEVIDDFLPKEQHTKLMEMFQSLGEFPAAKQDWTSTQWSHIGECYPPTIDGKCNQTYTMLNKETNECQFANRIDIGKHFITTGGFNGHKERYDTLVSRLHPFINYQFDAFSRPEFVELFEMDEFQNAVQNICGKRNPYFKPFQLSMILNLPGQSVPMHLDIPYFFPATRYAFPQWLLLVMQDSGLFAVQRLPQVQALVYVHDWDETDAPFDDYGGEFVLYPQGPSYAPKVVPAKPRSAIFCDGSEVVHGTSTFKPNSKVIQFDKDLDDAMIWDQDADAWRLLVDGKPTDYTLKWNEIRASIAYRGWCFNDKDTMNAWNPEQHEGDLNLDDIMDILKRDLINNKKSTTFDKWNSMSSYDRGLFLMDEYIKLPKPHKSRISFNYCVLFLKLPDWGVIKIFENMIC